MINFKIKSKLITKFILTIIFLSFSNISLADLPTVGQILDKGDPDNPNLVLVQEVFIACAGLYYALDGITGGHEVADRYSFGFMKEAGELTEKLYNNNNIDRDYMNTISRYSSAYTDFMMTKGITESIKEDEHLCKLMAIKANF